MSYESGSWVSPATSAYTEVAGALMQNNGIDPNTGDPIAGGGGGGVQLDQNWRQIGTEAADVAYLPYSEPNAGFRWLEGRGGNDTIWGGNNGNVIYGGTGSDSLVGGYCINLILGEDGNDGIHGNDLQDLLTGGTGNDKIFGYADSDYLIGDAGDDSLEGGDGGDFLQGGAGRDTVKGGTGNDFYYVDDTTDTLVELAGQGIDVVIASLNYSIATLPYFEHIGLIGNGTSATGNAGANIVQGNETKGSTLSGLGGNDSLYGGSGADVLDGGAGADLMVGGTGNDTYIVDHASDVVQEAAGGGIDTIRSSVSRTLPANTENLVLLGAAAINGTGNALANQLTGNAAANILTGGEGNDILNGGAGADTMNGGNGNDVYVVDNAADVIQEAASGGVDLVRSTVSRTLGANQEKLTLEGSGVINGTGNTLANTLVGNASNNVLSGGSGRDSLFGAAGNDILLGAAVAPALGAGEIDSLSGGLGADVFVLGIATGRLYDNGSIGTPGLTDYALITDFGNGADRLQLKGSASPQRYFLGNSPISGISGRGLYHDSNGNGVLNPATDELIALIQGPAAANALANAIYV